MHSIIFLLIPIWRNPDLTGLWLQKFVGSHFLQVNAFAASICVMCVSVSKMVKRSQKSDMWKVWLYSIISSFCVWVFCISGIIVYDSNKWYPADIFYYTKLFNYIYLFRIFVFDTFPCDLIFYIYITSWNIQNDFLRQFLVCA